MEDALHVKSWHINDCHVFYLVPQPAEAVGILAASEDIS